MQHQPLERISVSRKARRVSRRRCKVSFQNTQPFALQEEQYFFPLGGESNQETGSDLRTRNERGTMDIFFLPQTHSFWCRWMIGKSTNASLEIRFSRTTRRIIPNGLRQQTMTISGLEENESTIFWQILLVVHQGAPSPFTLINTQTQLV